MSAEGPPLQFELFSGALVDNRTRAQKRFEKQAGLPHQITMFSLKETCQIGVSARPWLKDLPRPQMVLVGEDPRTEEEKERDLLREAEGLTHQMFTAESHPQPEASPPPPAIGEVVSPSRRPVPPVVENTGYRVRARHARARIRYPHREKPGNRHASPGPEAPETNHRPPQHFALAGCIYRFY